MGADAETIAAEAQAGSDDELVPDALGPPWAFHRPLRVVQREAAAAAELAAAAWARRSEPPPDPPSPVFRGRLCIVAGMRGAAGAPLRALSASLSAEAGAEKFTPHCVLCGPVEGLPADITAETVQQALPPGCGGFAVPLADVVAAGEPAAGLEVDEGWDVALSSGEVGPYHAAEFHADLERLGCGGAEQLAELADAIAGGLGKVHCPPPPPGRRLVVGLLRGAEPDRAAEALRRVRSIWDSSRPGSVLTVLHVDSIEVWLAPTGGSRSEWHPLVTVPLSGSNASDLAPSAT
eukprot:TRINITY_DN8428_c0_g1_i1.p1 TRINITY_DN8428_c0_g1~~TRINITY_DN8428_c0_g1_i1.p1  ORF type:complete len:321 (+),score=68.32 TRINITY_DN8428_c0_g1_i1:90-965(+)